MWLKCCKSLSDLQKNHPVRCIYAEHVCYPVVPAKYRPIQRLLSSLDSYRLIVNNFSVFHCLSMDFCSQALVFWIKDGLFGRCGSWCVSMWVQSVKKYLYLYIDIMKQPETVTQFRRKDEDVSTPHHKSTIQTLTLWIARTESDTTAAKILFTFPGR